MKAKDFGRKVERKVERKVGVTRQSIIQVWIAERLEKRAS